MVALRSRASSASSVNPSARARFRPDTSLRARACPKVGKRLEAQSAVVLLRTGERRCARLRKVARPTRLWSSSCGGTRTACVARSDIKVCPGRYQAVTSRPSASSRRHEATVFSAHTLKRDEYGRRAQAATPQRELDECSTPKMAAPRLGAPQRRRATDLHEQSTLQHWLSTWLPENRTRTRCSGPCRCASASIHGTRRRHALLHVGAQPVWQQPSSWSRRGARTRRSTDQQSAGHRHPALLGYDARSRLMSSCRQGSRNSEPRLYARDARGPHHGRGPRGRARRRQRRLEAAACGLISTRGASRRTRRSSSSRRSGRRARAIQALPRESAAPRAAGERLPSLVEAA